MLHGSDDYRFIAVESMGIVKSYTPRTLAGDVQTMVDVSDVIICCHLISTLQCRYFKAYCTGTSHKSCLTGIVFLNDVMFQLPSNEWRYIHFPIVPTIDSGEMSVVISAFSSLRTDVEELVIEVAVSAGQRGRGECWSTRSR